MERYDSRRSSARGRSRSRGGQQLLDSYGRRSPHMLHGDSLRVRRRRNVALGLALLLVLALAVGGAAWWVFSRPVVFSVTATPTDAFLSVKGSIPGGSDVATASGALRVESSTPGVYLVTAARSGFETQTVSVDARRFKATQIPVALVALPQRISVKATPKSAAIVILSADGRQLAAGTGTVSAKLPTQQIKVQVTASSKNSFTRELLLDRATSLVVSLDPKGQVVHGLGMIETAGAPKGVAMTPDGTEAWATILNGPPSIQIFNPRTGANMGGVDMGKHGAVEVIFNRAGTRAYASQMETAKVFEIDVRSRKVLRGFKTESAWTKVVALSPDEKTLYAANWSGNDVSIIDIKSGKFVKRVPVAKTPRGLWPTKDGKYLYVGSFGIGWLEKIDLATYKVKVVFKGGGAMRHLVADETLGKLYTSDMAQDCVWVTDMKTDKTKRFVKVGHKPNTIALSPDGKTLFVSNRGENNPVSYYLIGPEWGSVMLIDTATGRLLDGVVGGNQCTALGVSADGKLLVFSDFLDNRLRVYEVPDYDALAAGNGGRADMLAKDVVK